MVALGSACSWLDDCAEVIRENDSGLGSNHLYSVAALTDNSGNVVERYRYDAYGQRTVLAADGTTVRAASSYGNQVGYTGRYEDRDTGLVYFRSRYHSPALGRFINRMPWNNVGGEILSNYEPMVMPTEWRIYSLSEILSSHASYLQGRLNLYDFMWQSGNSVEPFSTSPPNGHGLPGSLNREWPGGVDRNLTPDELEDLIRKSKGEEKCKYQKAKKLIEQARRLMGKGGGAYRRGAVSTAGMATIAESSLAVGAGIAIGSGIGYVIHEYCLDDPPPPDDYSGDKCCNKSFAFGSMAIVNAWASKRAMTQAIEQAKADCASKTSECPGPCVSGKKCKPTYVPDGFEQDYSMGFWTRAIVNYHCKCACE